MCSGLIWEGTVVPYCRNSRFLDFSFLKLNTKWMAPLIQPWYEIVTLNGANKQHPSWTKKQPKTVSCAFCCVQKSWGVDGWPAHFPLLSQHRVPKKAIPSHLADVLLQPLDPVHPEHEPELQRAEPPAQGDLPVLQQRGEPVSEITMAVTQQKVCSAMVWKGTTLPHPTGSC